MTVNRFRDLYDGSPEAAGSEGAATAYAQSGHMDVSPWVKRYVAMGIWGAVPLAGARLLIIPR